MYRKMTLLARGLKCGGLGARTSFLVVSALFSCLSASKAASAIAPKPQPVCRRKLRRLSGSVSDIATSDGGKRNRRIEREHHGRKKGAADSEIHAAAAGAVERPTLLGSPAALHEGGEMNGNARAELGLVQAARNRQDR